MRSALHSAMAGVVLLAPIFAFAQQQGGELQRAQVRDELVSLEHAGYTPGYPASLPAAQDRLSFGSVTDMTRTRVPAVQGSRQAGRAISVSSPQSLYFGL